MELLPASVALIIRALVVSARWAGRSRSLRLEQMTAAAEANRVAALEAQVAMRMTTANKQQPRFLRSW